MTDDRCQINSTSAFDWEIAIPEEGGYLRLGSSRRIGKVQPPAIIVTPKSLAEFCSALASAAEQLGWAASCTTCREDDIRLERAKQNAKWGVQNHNPARWLAILVEEVGEVAKAIVEDRSFDVRNELVQVAAVAVAAIESLDRNELRRS